MLNLIQRVKFVVNKNNKNKRNKTFANQKRVKSVVPNRKVVKPKDKHQEVTILVAAHKNYMMPADAIYKPVFVGNANKSKADRPSVFVGDNSGQNISKLNNQYNELTALYWGWKNLKNQTDALGLVHYRRYFSLQRNRGLRYILSTEEANLLLKENDFIVPKKRHYYIESNESHYIHAHQKEPLEVTKRIIKEKYPEYNNAFTKVLRSSSGHYFNMFIAKWDLMDQYSTFLFGVLEDVRKEINIESYSKNEQRALGFISELLLDTWLETNHVKYKEVKVVFQEHQNWLVKGGNFLKRKFLSFESKVNYEED